jgi:hypothetical protein
VEQGAEPADAYHRWEHEQQADPPEVADELDRSAALLQPAPPEADRAEREAR